MLFCYFFISGWGWGGLTFLQIGGKFSSQLLLSLFHHMLHLVITKVDKVALSVVISTPSEFKLEIPATRLTHMWLSGKKSSSTWHQKSQIAPKLINIWHQGHQNPSTIALWHNHMWGYFFILLISSFTQFWMATATNFKARIVSKVFSWGYRSTGAKRSKRVRPHEASFALDVAFTQQANYSSNTLASAVQFLHQTIASTSCNKLI